MDIKKDRDDFIDNFNNIKGSIGKSSNDVDMEDFVKYMADRNIQFHIVFKNFILIVIIKN